MHTSFSCSFKLFIFIYFSLYSFSINYKNFILLLFLLLLLLLFIFCFHSLLPNHAPTKKFKDIFIIIFPSLYCILYSPWQTWLLMSFLFLIFLLCYFFIFVHQIYNILFTNCRWLIFCLHQTTIEIKDKMSRLMYVTDPKSVRR